MDPQSRVEARLAKGFRDWLPKDLLVRDRIVDTLRAVYARYGFAPLATPAIEHLDVLLGKYGEESSKQIFRLTSPEDEPIALRFDLTVPLARVVAQYADLPRPFRRYQVAPVWRGDKPGPGRYREFTQFDIDIVGASSVAADVEILAAVSEAFTALGLGEAVVRVSSRRMLNTLVRFAGVPEARAHEVFRVLDKLDKQGLEAVRLELTTGRVDRSGDRIPGLGLDPAQVARIERFLTIADRGRQEVLQAVEELFGGTEGAADSIAELKSMDAQLDALGLDSARVLFDPTLARGLEYYSGPIFECILPQAPEFGSIFGGGRYDGLVERFLGTSLPATGGSIGVDRLTAALVQLGRVEERPSDTRVLIVNFDPGLVAEYHRMARELRAAGLATEVYLGDQRGLKKQLQHADRIGARVALLLGGDELARGEVSIKDLVRGSEEAQGASHDRDAYLKAKHGQFAVSRTELVAQVKKLLGD